MTSYLARLAARSLAGSSSSVSSGRPVLPPSPATETPAVGESAPTVPPPPPATPLGAAVGPEPAVGRDAASTDRADEPGRSPEDRAAVEELISPDESPPSTRRPASPDVVFASPLPRAMPQPSAPADSTPTPDARERASPPPRAALAVSEPTDPSPAVVDASVPASLPAAPTAAPHRAPHASDEHLSTEVGRLSPIYPAIHPAPHPEGTASAEASVVTVVPEAVPADSPRSQRRAADDAPLPITPAPIDVHIGTIEIVADSAPLPAAPRARPARAGLDAYARLRSYDWDE